MVLTMSKRELTLEIAYNVRHIGGYRTRRDKLTGDGCPVRSASLHGLTEAGVATLAEAGVRTIVDLRSGVEREASPTPDTPRFGIQVAAPVFEQDASPAGLSAEEFPGFATVYERMLESRVRRRIGRF